MGKKKQQLEVTPQPVTISLSDPGMTIFHKAGLAGLWMTLKALEADERLMRGRPTGADWRLDDRSVTLHWGDKPKALLDWITERAFLLDRAGLFWFPALGEPRVNYQQATVLQEAVLGTFLQHGQTRKADTPLNQTGSASVVIDDIPTVIRYRKVRSYAHQATDLTPGKPVELAGWYLPGGAERHVGSRGTSLEEPAERALVLRFAAVGAIYFKVRSVGKGTRPAFSLVIPEVTSLKTYARVRQRLLRFGIKELLASGSADAGMRVLAELEAAGLLADVRSTACRIVTFGSLPWSTQQKSRVHVMTVRANTPADLRTYSICRRLLPPQFVRKEGKEPFWDAPLVPDLVAANLSEGRPWYSGISNLLAGADKRRREHIMRYERGGLEKMVQDKTVLPDGPERIFVRACQEALRRHMGAKLGRPGGADLGTVVERIRVSISRCKNAATLRETLTDLWSRGGALHKGENTLLKAGDDWWQQVLPMFGDARWREARDLALLALASYPGSK